MARTWLSIRVELVEGHGERFWPRPGPVFAAARSHTFAQLAHAIDHAFARFQPIQAYPTCPLSAPGGGLLAGRADPHSWSTKAPAGASRHGPRG